MVPLNLLHKKYINNNHVESWCGCCQFLATCKTLEAGRQSQARAGLWRRKSSHEAVNKLGHPDHPHFHPPSPPRPPSPPTFPALKKKKSPSQLHLEKRRREATCQTPFPNLTASSVANAEDAKAEQASTPTIIKETVEKEDGEAAVIANVEEPAV